MKLMIFRRAASAALCLLVLATGGCLSLSRADGAACDQTFDISMQMNLFGEPHLTRLNLDGRAPGQDEFNAVDRAIRTFTAVPRASFTCEPDPRLELTGRAGGRTLTFVFDITDGGVRPLFEEMTR